jgi:hypothetical protein
MQSWVNVEIEKHGHDVPEAVAAGGSAGIQLGLNSATLTFILATGVQFGSVH